MTDNIHRKTHLHGGNLMYDHREAVLLFGVICKAIVIHAHMGGD